MYLKSKNKVLRKEKGITLIALVVTIIVLLILAGVSIATLTGENGILTRAQDAKNKTEQAEQDEQETLEDYELYIKEATGETVYRLNDIPKEMENPPTIEMVGESSALENSTWITPVTDVDTGTVNDVYTSFNSQLVQVNPYFPKYHYIHGINNIVNASSKSANFYTIEFDIDCQEFEIKLQYTGTNQFRIIVDDEYVSYNVTKESDFSGTVDKTYFYKVTFDSKKKRNIKIEITGVFGGVYINSNDEITKTTRKSNPKAVWIGTSITEGSAGTGSSMYGFPNIVSSMLGLECINDGLGATGYIATADDTRYAFYDRLQYNIIDRQPEIAIIEGGINDWNYETNLIVEEADKCYKYIKENAPNTNLIIIGVFWPKGSYSDKVKEVNEELRKTALDNNLPFIDLLNGQTIDKDGNVITDNKGPYITGTGCVVNEKNDGNADSYISSDTTHPTIEGHEYLGNIIATEMYKILNNIY